MNCRDYKERTLFVSNVNPQVSEELLYELFLQAGPLCKVVIPKSVPDVFRLKAFVTFKHVESTPYALTLLQGIMLYGTPLQLKFYRGSNFESQRRNILRNKSNASASLTLLSSNSAQLRSTTEPTGLHGTAAPARTAPHLGAPPPAVAASISAVQQSQVAPSPFVDTRQLLMSCVTSLKQSCAAQATGQVDAEKPNAHKSHSAIDLGRINQSVQLKHTSSHSSSSGSRNNGRSAEDRTERGSLTRSESGKKRRKRAQRGANRNDRSGGERYEGENRSMHYRRYSKSPIGRDNNTRCGVGHEEDDRSLSISRAGQHKSPQPNDGDRRPEGNHSRGSDSRFWRGLSERVYSPSLESKYRQGRSEQDDSSSLDSKYWQERLEQGYSPIPLSKYQLGRSEQRYAPRVDANYRQERSEQKYTPSFDSTYRLGRSQQGDSPCPDSKYWQERYERRHSPSPDSKYRQERSERRYSPPSPDSKYRQERSERRYSPSPDSKYRQERSEQRYSPPSPDFKYRQERLEQRYSPPSPDYKYRLARSDLEYSQNLDAKYQQGRSEQDYSRSRDESHLQGRTGGVYSLCRDAGHRVSNTEEVHYRSQEDTFQQEELEVELHSTNPDAFRCQDISRQAYSQNAKDTRILVRPRDRSRSASWTREPPSHTYSNCPENSCRINIVSQNSWSESNDNVSFESRLGAMSKIRGIGRRMMTAGQKRCYSAAFYEEDEYENIRKVDGEGRTRHNPDVVEYSLQESCLEGLNAPRRRKTEYLMERAAFKPARQCSSGNGRNLWITTVFQPGC